MGPEAGTGSEDDQDRGGRGRLEQAVDLCILAPIGLLADAGNVVPDLVARGRGQVSQARVVGRFTVEKAGGKVLEVQKAGLGALRRMASQARGADEQEGDGEDPVREPEPHGGEPAPSGPQLSAVADAPAVESLAIPDYDSLSASQVVPRLESLSADELEAVRLYELGSRGRKTILGRISQLQRPAG